MTGRKKAKASTNAKSPKRGRPRLLTPERSEQIQNAIRTGTDPVFAANVAGVSRSTWYEWQKKGKEDAEAGRNDSPEAELYLAAQEASADAVGRVERCFYAGATQDPRIAKDWLERAHKRRWSREDTQKIEHSGPGGEALNVALVVPGKVEE